MPKLSSNIPIEPTYGVFYSQLVRVLHANNDKKFFIENVEKLMFKLCPQNFNYNRLVFYLREFLTKFELKIVSKFSTILNVSKFKFN